MTLNYFSTEQVIEFCFLSLTELEQKITKLNEEFVAYSLKISKDEEPFSQHKHDSYLKMIETLMKCKAAQHNFVNELLNGKQ